MKYIIALSTGHSTKDPGAIGVNGIKEYNLNVNLVNKLLELKLYQHVDGADWWRSDLSYEDLPYPEHLRQTIAAINRSTCVGAIEIHHNASVNPNVKGGMVLWEEYDKSQKKRNENVANQSRLLAGSIARMLDWMPFLQFNSFKKYWRETQKEHYQANAPSAQRHIQRRLGFLKNVNKPSIIVEPGYISNPDDLQFVQKYCLQIAYAIYQGVIIWLKNL